MEGLFLPGSLRIARQLIDRLDELKEVPNDMPIPAPFDRAFVAG